MSGLLTSILRKDDVVFSDELNHASLIDGMRLSGARKIIYRHLDLNDLETALRTRSELRRPQIRRHRNRLQHGRRHRQYR